MIRTRCGTTVLVEVSRSHHCTAAVSTLICIRQLHAARQLG